MIFASSHLTVKLGTTAPCEVETGKAAAPAILDGVRALIVDDNRTNRRILEGLIKRWGMKPSTAADGESALAALSIAQETNEPYGLILTDMHMPNMDGFDLVERVKQKPELCTATIMMLTHYHLPYRSHHGGMSGFLLYYHALQSAHVRLAADGASLVHSLILVSPGMGPSF